MLLKAESSAAAGQRVFKSTLSPWVSHQSPREGHWASPTALPPCLFLLSVSASRFTYLAFGNVQDYHVLLTA